MKSLQVFKNLSPSKNPQHVEGASDFEYIGVVRCATSDGPVDARHIDGLEKNYDDVREFRAAAHEAGYLTKESTTEYDEKMNEVLQGSSTEETPSTTESKKSKKSKK